MRCSLTLLWNNDLNESEVLTELSEAELKSQLIAAIGIIEHPTLWQRIKAVFHPPVTPSVAAAVEQVLNQFKLRSTAAHFKDYKPRTAHTRTKQVRLPEDDII